MVAYVSSNGEPADDSRRCRSYMAELGAEVYAWAGMTDVDRRAGFAWALNHHCEFISEMGGELMAIAVEEFADRLGSLHAGMEATGTGIVRLQQVPLPFPVFNWDDLEIKQGLHNRYLVGLMLWNTYLNITHLTLHGRRVLVVGYGLVGEGIAQYARALGAHVLIK